MFHEAKKIINNFAKRFSALFRYVYDSKIILISICYVLVSTTVLIFLRNIGRHIPMGIVMVALILSISIFIVVFHMGNNEENRNEQRSSKLLRVIKCLHSRIFKIIFISILISCIRCAVFVDKEMQYSNNLKSFIDQEVSFYGYLITEPEIKLKNSKLRIYMLQGKDTDNSKIGNILVQINKYPPIQVGQVCKFQGSITEPPILEDFDYQKYLKNQKIYSILEYSVVECLDLSEIRIGNSIALNLIDWKNSVISKMDTNLPEPQSSLLAGIIFGQKRTFSENFDDAVRKSGVSHIVAASGYNVTILILVVNNLFSFINKRFRIVISLIFIWAFCFISGLSASIVRATIMSSIALIALFLGKNNSIHISIPLAAAIFVFINPAIIFDVGFQLSILATLGLVYLAPSLENLLKGRSLVKKPFIQEYLLTTLSCTLTTLPVSISTFGTFSIWSVLANVLILPAVESTMLFGVLGVVLGPLSHIFSRFFYLLTYIQLKYFEFVVYFIQSLGFGVFEISGIMKTVLVFLISISLFLFVLIYYPVNNDGYNYYLKDIQKTLD